MNPAGFVLAGAVGEHGAHAGLLQSLDDGVRVLRRVVDVRPVEHAGDAGVDCAERAQQVGGIDVVRRHLGAELALHDVAIVLQRAVRQHVAQEALPHVPVRIDEARHHDRVRSVDDLGIGRADVRPHRRDLAALDQHVGLLEVADRAVEREHAAALDQDRPAGRGGAGACCAFGGAITLAAIAGAATAPIAVVQRNCRRDIAGEPARAARARIRGREVRHCRKMSHVNPPEGFDFARMLRPFSDRN